MAAPKGNQFWKIRSKHGPDKLFESADLLWEACVEYFEWVEANPLWENKPFNYQGQVVDNPVEKMRAMTLSGLCLFLDIHEDTWRDWRATRKDLSVVITRAERTMYTQKLSGAAADLLNPNIIARELGLKDVSQQEQVGSGGGPIKTETKWTVEFVNATPPGQ